MATRNIFGKVCLTLSVGVFLSIKKVYSFPGFVSHNVAIAMRNHLHRQEYPTFYGASPLLSKERKEERKEDGKKNILMLSRGRESGVPFFQDAKGQTINPKDCNFTTVHYVEGVEAHIVRRDEEYTELLNNFPTATFDYIFIFNPGWNDRYETVYHDKLFLMRLKAILKRNGEILLENLFTREGINYVNTANIVCPEFTGFTKGASTALISQRDQGYPIDYDWYLEGAWTKEHTTFTDMFRYTRY